MKSIFKLDGPSKPYWNIITQLRTTEWSDIDTLLARHVCRDFAMLEEMSLDEVPDHLAAEVCERLCEGARLLKLKAPASTPTMRHKIVFEAINAS